MTERDDYRDDITEGTGIGEEDLSSADRAALDDASAQRGEDGTTAEDLDEGEASRSFADDGPGALEEEAERANRLPGEQD